MQVFLTIQGNCKIKGKIDKLIKAQLVFQMLMDNLRIK